MTINEHLLVHAQDAGNGYHGRCKYCNAPLVTDLGYCSWEGVNCIDREISDYYSIPDNIISYSRWRGLIWNEDTRKFVKPYSEEEYTIDELNDIILSLTA